MRLSRLRTAEWIVGVAALALLVVRFALPWFGVSGRLAATASEYGGEVQENGWNSLGVLGPLAVLVGVLGVAAWLLQATRAAPALPVSAVMIELPLSLALTLGLLIRVLLDHPQVIAGAGRATTAKPAAYAELVLAVAVLVGAYLSLRTDGIAAYDAPQQIETLAS